MRAKAEQVAAWLLALAAAGVCRAAQPAETIGSPLIPRQVTDTDSGEVFLYDGLTSPFAISGEALSWAFFDNQNAGRIVTPLLFRISGRDSFVLTGIGTTRTSTGTGIQSYPFGLLAGSEQIVGGQYTFGFTNRAYTVVQSNPVAGASTPGVIPFDRAGPGVPTDPWYATAQATTPGEVALHIGTVIGTGGIAIYNADDPVGPLRVYSAQMTINQYLADFNLDGKVDFNDLLDLAQHYGIASGATHAIGDANGDGAVNFDDLLIVAQEYGDGTSAQAAISSVPEPSAAIPIAGIATVLLRRRR